MSPFCWCLSSLRIIVCRMGLWDQVFTLMPNRVTCPVLKVCWQMQESCSMCTKWHFHACIWGSLTWALNTIIQVQCMQCTYYICVHTLYTTHFCECTETTSALACLKLLSTAVVLLQLFTVKQRSIAPLLHSTSLVHPHIIIYFHPVLSGAGNALWFTNCKSPICHDT